MKGVSKSQTKKFEFQDYYNCVFGEKHQKVSNNYILNSINHGMYLQKVSKTTLLAFDEKCCCLKEYESIPWD